MARHLGEARARLVANNMEYDWRRDREYNRAKLADVHIQSVIDFHPPLARRVDELYEGDEDHWRLRWRIWWSRPVEEMRQQFVRLAREVGWRPKDAPAAAEWNPSTWTFEDQEGRTWRARATILADRENAILLEVRVERGEGEPRDEDSPDAR